ncbi:MAG: MFS transporter [Magnetococcales bacterium]|nr:MFS transporter [Magnetococcales bacterium]
MASRKQWNSFYLLSALSTLVLSLTVGIQPLFLDEVLAISFEQSGSINAHLQVVTQVVSLAIVGYSGSITSRQRRVSLLFYGFMIASFGAVLAPLSKQVELLIGLEGLAFYYVMRILVSLGTDTVQLQLSTLSGDAVLLRRSSRLLVNTVFMMVFGGTLLYAIFMQIPETATRIEWVMFIPAIAALIGAQLAKTQLPGLMPPRKKREGGHRFERVWELVSSDPRMQLCFAAAFYTRADMIVIGLFFSLWSISMADVIGVTRDMAAARAGLLIGIMGLVVLLAMPLWKRFMATHSRIEAIGASLSLSGVGFLLLGQVTHPFSWTILGPLVLIGLGQGGCLVAPKILAAELSPRDILGSVQGMFHLVSGIGVVLLVQSGGYYFDAVGPRAPFIIIGSGHLFVMFYALWMVIRGQDETAGHVLKKTAHKIHLKTLIFMMALLPLLWLMGRVLVSGYTPGSSLGQMPVGFINRYLGDWAFNFLLISLALRPVYEVTGVKVLARFSRMIGLYAFFYACLHVLTYLWLEWVFKWPAIIKDFDEREFIILGLMAFVLLVVLAVTSSNHIIRTMGGKRWKMLHRSVYLINLLVMAHFIMAASHDNGEPYVYGMLVLALLGYRMRRRRASLRQGGSTASR